MDLREPSTHVQTQDFRLVEALSHPVVAVLTARYAEISSDMLSCVQKTQPPRPVIHSVAVVSAAV